MICPNFSDPVVKQEFEELVSAIGEVAAYDVWNQNNGNSIDKAPNGEPSKLFTDLLSHFKGNRVLAIQAKSKVFSKSFKTWFGDWLGNDQTNVSKATDRNGEPLVLFHGTKRYGFKEFSKEKLGNNTGAPSAKLAFFFTDNREVSESYSNTEFSEDDLAEHHAIYNQMDSLTIEAQLLWDDIDELMNEKSFLESLPAEDLVDNTKLSEELASLETSIERLSKALDKTVTELNDLEAMLPKSGMYAVYLNVKNPLVLDYHFKRNRNVTYADALLSAKRSENDGTIFKHTDDSGGRGVFSNVFTTFEPNQIKSVNNQGTFSNETTLIDQYRLDLLNKSESMYPESMKILQDAVDIHDTKSLMEYVATNDTDETRLKIAKLFLKLNEQGLVSELPVVWDMSLNAVGVHRYGVDEELSDSNKIVTRGMDLTFNPIELSYYNHLKIFEILTHEVVHNLTSELLMNDADFFKLANNTYQKYQNTYKDKTMYDLNEFVTRFLTDPEVRQNVAEMGNKKWYVKLYEALKNFFTGLFKTAKVKPEEMTVDTLLEYITSYVQESPLVNTWGQIGLSDDLLISDYFSAPNNRIQSIADKAVLTNQQIKEGVQNRIRALQGRTTDPFYVKEVRRLLEVMDGMENQDALMEFVKYLRRDLEIPFKFIQKAYDGQSPINSTQLVQFKQDYLGFYEPMLSKIADLMSTGYFDNMYLEEKQDLEKFSVESRNILARIRGMYNHLVQEEFANTLRKAGISAKSPTIEKYISNNIIETDSDISWFELYLGSMNNANDEALRAVYYVISNVKNDIERATFARGKRIANVAGATDKHLLLFERDKSGKKTGYLVRDKNYGELKRDYKAFLTQLAEEYGLDQYDDVPMNENFVEYNQKKTRWLAKYAERRYTPDYYELFAGLSLDTAMAREEIQLNINRVLNNAKMPDGNRDLMKLRQSDWEKLQNLYQQKRRLANRYHEDGLPKQGIELQIAIELSAVNDALQDGMKYQKNVEAWTAEREAAKAGLTSSQFAIWDERNSRTEYSKEFTELLKMIQKTEYGFEYDRLSEVRKEVLSLFRNNNDMQINYKSMSEDARALIEVMDVKMQDIRNSHQGIKVKSRLKFNEIATMETTIDYKIESNLAKQRDKTTPGAWEEWRDKNHYFNEKTGKYTPYSYWTYLKPKNPDYILTVPSSAWSEVSPESKYYNHAFDGNDDQYIQPKKFDENGNVLYDNTPAYNAIMSDPSLKALYDEILSAMTESNLKLTFQQNMDPYKLPQISGTLYQHLRASDSVLKGFRRFMMDNIVVKNDDIDYNTGNVKRPDGSKLYFVPTHYMKMLDNPETLTNDIAGATIAYFRMAENYKQMNRIAPYIEVVKEQIGARVYNKKANLLSRRAETVVGTDTNAYKKMDQFLKMHLYGERKEELNATIPGINKTVSVTKIMSAIRNYTQAVNLSFNLTAIEVGALTGMHHALLESLVGRYYTRADFAKGTATVMKNLLSIIGNWGNYRSNNKLLALLEYNQVSRTNDEVFDKLNYTRAGRFITNHLWYGGYSGGDFVVKSSILTAIYMNHKLVTDPQTGKKSFMNKREYLNRYWRNDKNSGEQIWKTYGESLYDAYEAVGGRVIIKEQYKPYVDTILENSITNIAKNLAAKADGVLNDLDRAYIHANAFTQFVFMHRNFMVINIQDRVTKEKMYNYQTGVMDEALYRTLLRLMWEYFNTGIEAIRQKNFELLKKLPEVDASDKANLTKLTYELAMMACYYLVTQLLDKEADDDDSLWLTQHLAYMAKRHYFEIHAQYDVTDLVNIVKSPSAAMGTLNQIGFLLDLAKPWVASNFEDSYGKTVTRGPYKGWFRYQQSLIKATPFKHLIEAKDPNLKRRYLDNMILK